VFFSSHILGEVQRMCNRVAIIKEGGIMNIQDIKSMQRDNYIKVRIVAEALDQQQFAVDGVNNLIQDNGATSFLYKGDINVVTRLISQNKIADLTIEEPTLEEIFMHYYE
jgi:ABC-2 type transport system ATP-binding protein